MDLGLGGKAALVTGGSEGIGMAVARKLAQEGVRVAICARTEATLRETATEITKAADWSLSSTTCPFTELPKFARGSACKRAGCTSSFCRCMPRG